MNENIKFESDLVYAVPSTDKSGREYSNTLVGSYVVIPKSHVETPFDLSEAEWIDTKKMIDTVKQHLDQKYKPDGYNLGWNVGRVGGQTVPHVHLHIIPRFEDEPFAGRGIRYWLKKDENIRQNSGENNRTRCVEKGGFSL